jgi:hypothetical protein
VLKPTVPGWLGHFVKHLLLPAIVLAMLMMQFEHRRALDFMDVVGLRLAAPLQLGEPAPPEWITFRIIDTATYVSEFNGSSPLNPQWLAKWLEEQVPLQRRALAIDLQMEPWPGQSRAELDSWLRRSAAARPLVLPVPQQGWTAEVHARSFSWMREMCAAGVHFADPRLREHQGWVVRLDNLPDTLAQTTGRLMGQASRDEQQSVSLCDAAMLLPDLDALYKHLDLESATLDLHHTAPLRPGLVAALTRKSAEAVESPGALRACADCVVMVGGSYDANDQFRIPSMRQPVSGLVVHAAALVTGERVKSMPALNFGMDIVLGIGVGWLLARPHNPAASPRWRWLSPLLISLLVLLPMVLAALLMNLGLWVNPLPMVVAMWLHAKAEPVFKYMGRLLTPLQRRALGRRRRARGNPDADAANQGRLP